MPTVEIGKTLRKLMRSNTCAPPGYACGLRFGVYAGLFRSHSAVPWGPMCGVMAAANVDPQIKAQQVPTRSAGSTSGPANPKPTGDGYTGCHGGSLTLVHATYPSRRLKFELAIQLGAVIDPLGSLRNRLGLSPSGDSWRSLLCCCGLRAIE